MDISYLVEGFGIALQWQNIMWGIVGCTIGTVVGALPAIGPSSAIALIIPLLYAMNIPVDSTMIVLASVYFGAEYGGRITSILLNVPGDAGAVMTAMDGYPLARQGRAAEALAISGISSFVGGIIGAIGITLVAPPLSAVAIGFGPAEYFALIVFSFATLTSMVGDRPLKTMIGCIIGIMLATIGLDPTSGAQRFTFGEPELFSGLDFIILIIGLFSLSEVFILLQGSLDGTAKPLRVTGKFMYLKNMGAYMGATLRASGLGFIIGLLPGVGSSVASVISYSTEKRLVDKGTFGKGDIRGLAAPEAANNSSATGAFVPMLTLGVPGSSTTAVMLGALMLYNITPGPQFFVEQPALAAGLIASMYVANVILLVLNLPLMSIFVRILEMPVWALVSGILGLSFVGVYASYGSILSIFLTVVVGMVGYLLRRAGFDVAPIILGFVLGGIAESNLRNALAISGGDVGILFKSWISISLWGLAVLIALAPFIIDYVRRARSFGARSSDAVS